MPIFQIDRAFVGIDAFRVCSVYKYGIEICLILVHFLQRVLPLLLYECNDKSLVNQMLTISFPNNSRTFWAELVMLETVNFTAYHLNTVHTGDLGLLFLPL